MKREETLRQGYAATSANAVGEAYIAICAIPLPTPAETLAHARELPEIKELVEFTSVARDIAMRWAFRARVPECGSFAEISQDLDAALAALEPKP